MNKSQIEKCKKIIDYYKWGHQSIKLIEEMSELAIATTKIQIRPYERAFNSDIPDKLLHNYWEEIADVLIILEQLIQNEGDDAKKYIKRMITYKLDRQLERIKNEQGL